MSVRISGVNIPEDKQIRIALTYIYGIGRSLANEILEKTGLDPAEKAKHLTDVEKKKLQKLIETQYIIEGELRRRVLRDIKRLKAIKCWRGIRHIKGLPVRGQTTQKNSRTVRGNVRRTMTSGRKSAPAPK